MCVGDDDSLLFRAHESSQSGTSFPEGGTSFEDVIIQHVVAWKGSVVHTGARLRALFSPRIPESDIDSSMMLGGGFIS